MCCWWHLVQSHCETPGRWRSLLGQALSGRPDRRHVFGLTFDWTRTIARPSLHERPPLLQSIAAPIGLLRGIANNVGQRRLCQFSRKICGCRSTSHVRSVCCRIRDACCRLVENRDFAFLLRSQYHGQEAGPVAMQHALIGVRVAEQGWRHFAAVPFHFVELRPVESAAAPRRIISRSVVPRWVHRFCTDLGVQTFFLPPSNSDLFGWERFYLALSA
jgi:hypothetical protein